MQVRMIVAAGFLAAATLTACNPSTGTDSSSTSTATTPSTPAGITVPKIPKGKVTGAGDLCGLIPADKAAEVLGKPTVTLQAWTTELDPDVVDACNVAYFGEDGSTRFVLNVFVRTGAKETLWQARQLAANSGFEVTEHRIPGSDEAFYVHREGNIRKGDMLFVGNGSVGEQNPARTMAFLAMVANAVG